MINVLHSKQTLAASLVYRIETKLDNTSIQKLKDAYVYAKFICYHIGFTIIGVVLLEISLEKAVQL